MNKKSFLVLGAGRFGISVAKTLSRLGQEVCIIDKDSNIIQDIAEDVTQAVVGDSTDETVLKAIGVANFDVAIVALSENVNTSILTTTILKEMGVECVISRADNDIHRRILEKIGADRILMPEQQMGDKLAHRLASVKKLDDLELSEEFSVVQIACPSKWVGKNPVLLDVRNKYGVNIIAVERGEDVLLAITGDDKFRKDDVLVIVGRNEDIEALK